MTIKIVRTNTETDNDAYNQMKAYTEKQKIRDIMVANKSLKVRLKTIGHAGLFVFLDPFFMQLVFVLSLPIACLAMVFICINFIWIFHMVFL